MVELLLILLLLLRSDERAEKARVAGGCLGRERLAEMQSRAIGIPKVLRDQELLVLVLLSQQGHKVVVCVPVCRQYLLLVMQGVRLKKGSLWELI